MTTPKMPVLTLSDVDVSNKRVLIREDFNVPLKPSKDGWQIQSDLRLQAALPTLKTILMQKPKQVIILSHLGRPTPGQADPEYSLAPIAQRLSALLNYPVKLYPDMAALPTVAVDHIILLENVRFFKGETQNDPTLSKQLAALCDVFVMDAFATAHREHASTYGVVHDAPTACAGLLLTQELTALDAALQNPKPPLMAIVGGAKVSSKLGILKNLLPKVDYLIIGGGMANTFLAAKGLPVGKSLCESGLIDEAKTLLTLAAKHHTHILLPEDVQVATTLDETVTPVARSVTDVLEDEMIFDIGQKTIQQYTQAIAQAGTIVWNGPVGVFECKPFAAGTLTLAQAVADANAFSMAGGGDTLAAIEKAGLQERISYISTGGGAFLTYLEGKPLPAITALTQKKELTS